MLKSLRELGEFALGIVSDCIELLWMLQVPVIASSTHGSDRVKALQLSVFVGIVTLIVWTATAHASEGQSTALSVATVSAIYISFAAWVMNSFLAARSLYVTPSEVKSDALTSVLAFTFVVVVLATMIIEFDLFVFRHRPFGIQRWDSTETKFLLVTVPVLAASALAISNSLRYGWSQSTTAQKAKFKDVVLFVLLNGLLSMGFVYLIYVVMLTVPK